MPTSADVLVEIEHCLSTADLEKKVLRNTDTTNRFPPGSLQYMTFERSKRTVHEYFAGGRRRLKEGWSSGDS